MTDNRTELKRQLAETRAQMERLEAALEQAEEWEPEGGVWAVDYSLPRGIFQFDITGTAPDYKRLSGFAYPTREQAERARDLMRVHNRALAYVQEHAPDFDPEKDEAWEIYWDYDGGDYRADSTHGIITLGTVIGPSNVMVQLAADLNSGRVKL